MAWYSTKENVTGLVNALTQARVLTTAEDASDVLNRPQRWTEYYQAWAASGYATPGDEDWDDFVAEVTNLEEDNEEDEDESENDESESEGTESEDDES